MRAFRFLRPAETELLEQISYYASIQSELGVRFERAVASAVRLAVAHPEHGAPRSKNSRRRLVKGFPFGIVYQASEHEVLIIAVAHLRKTPDYWASRVK